MKNDIRNLYWPGLYNVKFVHNGSGSMLVEMNELRADLTNDLTNIPTSGRLSCAPKTVLLLKVTYIRHKQLFSCLDRKSK